MDLQNSTTKKMITLSMLIALQVVLTRIFSINAWNIRIGFGFIPMLFAALYFGTWESVTVAALADIIGSLALSSYPYFPGYTFSILKRNKSSLSIFLAVLLTQLVCSLLLNSLWISINSGSPLLPIMLTRLIQVGINGAMQFFTIQFMVYFLEKRFRVTELNS